MRQVAAEGVPVAQLLLHGHPLNVLRPLSLTWPSLPAALPFFLFPGADAEGEFCTSTLPAHFASVATPNSRAVAQAAPPPLPAGDRGFVPEVRQAGCRTVGTHSRGWAGMRVFFFLLLTRQMAGSLPNPQPQSIPLPVTPFPSSLPPPSLWRVPRQVGRGPQASPLSPLSSRPRSCARLASTCLAWPAARSHSYCSLRWGLGGRGRGRLCADACIIHLSGQL